MSQVNNKEDVKNDNEMTEKEEAEMLKKRLQRCKFEMKKVEMMIDKLNNQNSRAQLSVLSSSVEKDGFWYNETVLSKRFILSALKLQREAYRRELRKHQVIQSA